MNKITRFCAFATVAVCIFSSCSKDEETTISIDEETELSNESIATNVINLMQDESSKNEVITYLAENKTGGTLQKVYNKLNKTENNETAIEQMATLLKKSEEALSIAEETGIVQVPELWMYTPDSSLKSEDILISYAPEGDEESWEKITAYDLQGNVYYLDPYESPSQRVIVVELNGAESLKLKVDLMNKELKAYGLQSNNSEIKAQLKSTDGLETTKISKISLNDDKDPWIKGAAEIYAITSGIKGTESDKEAEIQIVGMPYLDYEETDYYPNQVILFWDDYAYQAANIQLYEQDSNYNYKELVKIIVEGVFAITGTLSGEAWLTALGEVASAIVDVMPDEWYTDDDDYVDSFYTIMKDETYTDYYGAGANAKISMAPYFIPSN